MVVRRAGSASLPPTGLDEGNEPEQSTSEPALPAPRDALFAPATARFDRGQNQQATTHRESSQESVASAGWFDRLVRFARGLGVVFAILYFWSGAFVLTWFVLPRLYWQERDPLTRRRRMQLVVASSWRWFHRQLERATLYRCAYVGDELVDGPAVLVANHPTLLDVTAILARVPHACCVVKSSLIRSPLVGRLLRACGHVAAGDGSLMAGIGVLDAVTARLQEGFPVLVFPEGTRSPLGGMHRFRRGAFEIAKRGGVPIVPLFLRCDPPALGKGTPVWQHPRRCPTLTVHVGKALPTTALDPTDLCKNVERDFRARLVRALPSREPPT